MTIKVLIADDHAIVREGLRLMLALQEGISVVGEARNGKEAVTKAEALLPDILLMDICMPELNGIEATKILRDSLPSVKVIILSMHNTSDVILQAMRAGAWAYITKDSTGIDLQKAISAAMNGRQFISKGVGALAIDVPQVPGMTVKCPLSSLSRRERETLKLLAEGNTNADIAELCNISPKSVETYRSRLMLKLGISNVPALVKFRPPARDYLSVRK